MDMIKPRNYQLEMLEESLERNIIVAVSCYTTQSKDQNAHALRWTPAAGKLKCMSSVRRHVSY